MRATRATVVKEMEILIYKPYKWPKLKWYKRYTSICNWLGWVHGQTCLFLMWIRHVLTDPKWRESEIVAIGYVTKKCLPWASTTIKIMAFPQFRWWKPLGFSNGGYTNPPIVLMVVGIPGFGLGRYVWCVLMTWLKSNSASFEDGRSDWPTLLYNVYPGLQTPLAV